ncbi:hypothetical protein P12x_002124 [Tundrisphaera lichenicola]|uniref:hypothetical protein n=1 Tax=Tundrisphaera lichenicola TaxID=2029860 RepID=UPI003EBB46B2
MRSSRSLPTAARNTLSALIALWMAQASMGQAPSGEMPSASTPSKTTRLADLTHRFLFSEHYGREEDKATPSKIGPYRVGVIEVARDIIDTPQGAPRQMESVRQSIFIERPAELNGTGGVMSSIRKFEGYRARPEDPARMMGPKPLEGLTVLIRPQPGELPQVQSLTEGRSLTDYEYQVTARQSFVPYLGLILPPRALRLEDTWPIHRRAAQAMLGEAEILGDTLVGKFVELRKEVDGPRMVARLTVSGKAPGTSGDVVVNAEALFTFWPESPPEDSPNERTFPPSPTKGVIDARGAITELRLARLTTATLPGPGRLRFRSNREVIVHRQLGLPPDAAGPASPDSLPAVSESNSWLTYLEPSGQFSMKHPQDLLPPDRGPVAPLEPNAVTMVRVQRTGTDLLQIEYAGRTLAPEDLKKKLAARWEAMKLEVLPGVEEWLPEAEWPGMRVHRIEAAVKVAEPGTGAGATAGPGPSRIHFGGYLVQFGQSASILAIATTSRDAVASYQGEVEQILKTIKIGPTPPR